jgi:cytoskeleton protein RodZ
MNEFRNGGSGPIRFFGREGTKGNVLYKSQFPSDIRIRSEHEGGAGVGALLRASRLRCGEDLHHVAQTLRIRYPYLEAIEDGRFDDLPGGAYAVGFIRTYADHLGLNSDEVVRRFKSDSASIDGKTELVFPAPVPEGGIPGGALLFVGLLVAGVAYGGWYVSSTPGSFLADLVSPPPEHMASVSPEPLKTSPPEPVAENIGGGSEPETPSPASATAAIPTQGSMTHPARDLPAQEIVDATPPVASAPPPQAFPEPITAAPPPVPQPAPPADHLSSPEPPLPPERVVEKTPAPAVVEPPAAAAPELSTVTAPPAPLPAPTIEVASATPQPEPTGRVYGATEGVSHILLRATMDSWIQVRDDVAKQLLMTRLLRPGDSYRVPDRPGLKLLTGDAGALEVLVDGQVVPSLGPRGAVRRDVALDTELLRQGKAVLD